MQEWNKRKVIEWMGMTNVQIRRGKRTRNDMIEQEFHQEIDSIEITFPSSLFLFLLPFPGLD
jgi:hypothetical protein